MSVANHAAVKKSPFENWKDTINTSKTNPKWNDYDGAIKKTVEEYNRHLGNMPGYFHLDWRLIKAMIWVETGVLRTEWNKRPIQIGNFGDPGMATILSGREGSALVIPPSIRRGLTAYKIQNDPIANIQAGVGYLLTKCARYGTATIMDPNDSKQYDHTVKPHDTLSKIAAECGTTVELLRNMNKDASVLRPTQVMHYKKASIKPIITGWTRITTSVIATRYNGGGDPKYREKLEYCLSLIQYAPCWKEICH